MRKILFLFLFLTLISGAFAQTATAPYGEQYNLVRNCQNNGSDCSPTASCNLTVASADTGIILVDNQPLTNQNNYFNYTFYPLQLPKLGEYPSKQVCSDSGGAINGQGYELFTIQLTADGKPYQSFPIQIMLFIFGMCLIVLGKYHEDFSILQSVGAIMVMIFGVITLYPGYSYINWTNLYGKVMGSASFGLGFYFMIEKSFSRDNQVESYSQIDDGRYHG